MHTLSQLKTGSLKGITSLKLSEGLTEFPREIFELSDTLEVLDLSGNGLSELPEDFGRLKKLKILFCSNNPFTVLPEVIGDCPELDIAGFKACKIEKIPAAAVNPNLRWLILTDNSVKELPGEIGECARMQKLMLAGNQLITLPEELSRCSNLALLRISANRLTELPQWLLHMPKLSWLAFSGNEFSHTGPVTNLPKISWQALEILSVLGEGASGNIYKARWSGIDVAVKIYKGSVTSDGLPEDEMTAAIAAGEHTGLIKLIGEVASHPEGRHGLVMELIPPGYTNLGGPPGFQSCTRDVFKPGQAISAQIALSIATTIASVAQHLHGIQVMHGDLYAHNTLVDNLGRTLISDFGAASFYANLPPEMAAALERIEVSAFGYMLDDLVGLCTGVSNRVVASLGLLRDECLSADVVSRPCFATINSRLASIRNSL